MAGLGRHEDALAGSTEAVEIYRELTAGRPGAFRPYLAGSLTSLGIKLTELGDFDAALSADRKAATIYAALNSIDPERYRDSLQQEVNNLEIILRDLGRSEAEIANELDRLLSTDNILCRPREEPPTDTNVSLECVGSPLDQRVSHRWYANILIEPWLSVHRRSLPPP